MSITSLHPEELLDKDAHGTLTELERERLEAHLARCPACRFDRQLRADFADEFDDDFALTSQQLVALVEGQGIAALTAKVEDKSAPAPLAAPEPQPEPAPAPEPDLEDLEVAAGLRSTRRSRSRRGVRVWLLVAAALFVGGVAGAGVHQWTRRAQPAEGPETTYPEREAPTSLTTGAARAAHRAMAPPVASNAAPETALGEPAAPPSAQPSSVPAGPLPVRAVALAAAPPAESRASRAASVRSSSFPAAAPAARVPTAAPKASEPSIAPASPPALDGAGALFDSANDARRHGDHARALELYRSLQRMHGGSREAHVSYATVGQLLLDRGDAAGALTSFDAYNARGAGELDEPVLVGRATALERLGRDGDARAVWRSLLAVFPRSPYARHARARLGTSN